MNASGSDTLAIRPRLAGLTAYMAMLKAVLTGGRGCPGRFTAFADVDRNGLEGFSVI
jgi:hypothetical protein